MEFQKEVWMEEASSSRVVPRPFTAREKMLLQGFKDYLVKTEVLSTPQENPDELSSTNKRCVCCEAAALSLLLLIVRLLLLRGCC